MKLYDFGTSALVLAFLGGFFLSFGAVTFGEPVDFASPQNDGVVAPEPVADKPSTVPGTAASVRSALAKF